MLKFISFHGCLVTNKSTKQPKLKELYFQWIILKDSRSSKPVPHPFENPGVFLQSRDQRSTGGKCWQMHVASVQVEFKVLSLCCCLKKASTIRNSDNRDLLSSITSGCRQLLFLWSRGMGSDYLVTVISRKIHLEGDFYKWPSHQYQNEKKG